MSVQGATVVFNENSNSYVAAASSEISSPSLSSSAPPAFHPKLDPRASLRLVTKSSLPSFRRLTSNLLPIRYPDNFYTSLLGPEIKTLAFGVVAVWSSANDTDNQSSTSRINKHTSSKFLSHSSKPSSEGQVVGGISCRIEPLTDSATLRDLAASTDNINPRYLSEHSPHLLYISTLSTLSPFRQFGIGSALLEAAVSHGLELIQTLNENLGLTSFAVPDDRTTSKVIIEQRPVIGDDTSVDTGSNRRKKELSLEYVYAHVWEANDDAAEWYGRRGFEVGLLQPGYYRKLKPAGARIVSKAIGAYA